MLRFISPYTLMNDKDALLLQLAKHLTALREAKGLSMRQLAAAAGLEYSHIQRIEKGKVNIAFTTLVALADGLELSLDKLVTFPR